MKVSYSFVMPAYKANYLRQAIDSILSQSYTEFELIIVNDASPEDLDSIVNSYSDPRIRYYKNVENIGGRSLVEQWNYCMTLCDTDYIILASDDDVYSSEYLIKMHELVIKYPTANVFRPRVQIIDEANNVVKVEGYLQEKTSLIEYIYMYHHKYIFSGIPYYIFRRDALIRMHGFVDLPLAWGSDDATVMSLATGNDIISVPDILFSFRMSGENITSKKNDNQALKKKIQARKMYYSFLSNMLNYLKPNSEMEIVYWSNLKRNQCKFAIKNFYELLCDSTVLAGVLNICEFNRIPYISWRWLLLSYAKRIGQSLLGY